MSDYELGAAPGPALRMHGSLEARLVADVRPVQCRVALVPAQEVRMVVAVEELVALADLGGL